MDSQPTKKFSHPGFGTPSDSFFSLLGLILPPAAAAAAFLPSMLARRWGAWSDAQPFCGCCCGPTAMGWRCRQLVLRRPHSARRLVTDEGVAAGLRSVAARNCARAFRMRLAW